MSMYGHGITRSKHEIVSTDVAGVQASRICFILKTKPKCRSVFVVII